MFTTNNESLKKKKKKKCFAPAKNIDLNNDFTNVKKILSTRKL